MKTEMQTVQRSGDWKLNFKRNEDSQDHAFHLQRYKYTSDLKPKKCRNEPFIVTSNLNDGFKILHFLFESSDHLMSHRQLFQLKNNQKSTRHNANQQTNRGSKSFQDYSKKCHLGEINHYYTWIFSILIQASNNYIQETISRCNVFCIPCIMA